MSCREGCPQGRERETLSRAAPRARNSPQAAPGSVGTCAGPRHQSHLRGLNLFLQVALGQGCQRDVWAPTRHEVTKRDGPGACVPLQVPLRARARVCGDDALADFRRFFLTNGTSGNNTWKSKCFTRHHVQSKTRGTRNAQEMLYYLLKLI